MSRDEIEAAGYEAVYRSSSCDVMRKLFTGEPSNPVDILNPLFRFEDLETGNVVEVERLKFKVKVSRLCDYCEDSTNLLYIADGLRLCPDCSKSLDRKAKIAIQAQNPGFDPEDLGTEFRTNSEYTTNMGKHAGDGG